MQLADLLADQCFPEKAGGRTGLWAKAQLHYLKRIRKRPRGAQTYAAPRLMQDVPSGGERFNEKIQQQCAPAVLHGILASYRSKSWAVQNGFRVSIGTVGTERHWRNMQRRARNVARSSATPETVDTLNIFRWVSEVQTRLSKDRMVVHARLNASARMWLLSASQRLASIFVQGPDVSRSLLADMAEVAPVVSQSSAVGNVYDSLLQCRL